jgi:hypothetical protein
MVTERQIEEIVARGVSLMVFYHNSPRTPGTDEMLTKEVRGIAGWAAEASLGGRETAERILRPLSSELIARYGDAVGARLSSDFCAAFGSGSTRSSRPPRVGGSGPTDGRKR